VPVFNAVLRMLSPLITIRMRSRAASIAATTAAILVFSDPVHFPTATAESLNVQEVRTIEAPRVFHPPTEDTPGYWQDFGITTAFDFSKSTHLLVAIVKDAAGPTRLFTFDLEQATIKSQLTVSTNPHAEINSIRLSPDGKVAAVPTGEDEEIVLWNVESGARIDGKHTDGKAGDVDWHPSGELLASRVWPSARSDCRWSWADHTPADNATSDSPSAEHARCRSRHDGHQRASNPACWSATTARSEPIAHPKTRTIQPFRPPSARTTESLHRRFAYPLK
jgi:WD40 repeat protein